MYARVHERVVTRLKRRVVAACDAALVGKVLRNANGAELDLRKYKAFYVGERVTEEELEALLKGAENVNLVGKKVITVASRVLPVRLSDAKRFGGHPHVQVYAV